MDAYLTKKPIKFVGFLAGHVGEIIAPPAKEITLPWGEMEPPNSPLAVRTGEPVPFPSPRQFRGNQRNVLIQG
jgi:hypothetical protein